MKKVCILRASPRKGGHTNTLANAVEQRLLALGFAVTNLDLYDMDLKPCLACRVCQEDWGRIYCAQRDDMQRVFDAVSESDLVLLASPIYSWYCTPPLKCALDRMVYAFNMYYGAERGPSLWEGKAVALVTSSGYREDKGPDLLVQGLTRYCKHSKLRYLGSLWARHPNTGEVLMSEEKRAEAVAFADALARDV